MCVVDTTVNGPKESSTGAVLTRLQTETNMKVTISTVSATARVPTVGETGACMKVNGGTGASREWVERVGQQGSIEVNGVQTRYTVGVSGSGIPVQSTEACLR